MGALLRRASACSSLTPLKACIARAFDYAAHAGGRGRRSGTSRPLECAGRGRVPLLGVLCVRSRPRALVGDAARQGDAARDHAARRAGQQVCALCRAHVVVVMCTHCDAPRHPTRMHPRIPAHVYSSRRAWTGTARACLPRAGTSPRICRSRRGTELGSGKSRIWHLSGFISRTKRRQSDRETTKQKTAFDGKARS